VKVGRGGDRARRTGTDSEGTRRDCWCRAALASGASKARSRRRNTRAKTKVPYLGLCLGMQIGTIEFARHVLRFERPTRPSSTETRPTRSSRCWTNRKNHQESGPCGWERSHASWSWAHEQPKLYGAFVVNERHRHRYEFNNVYRDKFEKADFVFSGNSPDGNLVEGLNCRTIPSSSLRSFIPNSQQTAPTAPLVQGSSPAATRIFTSGRCDFGAAGNSKDARRFYRMKMATKQHKHVQVSCILSKFIACNH